MAVRTATGGKADWAPETAPGSGIPGSYTNIPEVRKWTLAPSIEAKEYASSSTAGAKKRLPGTADFDLSIDVYIDEATRFDSDLGIKPGVVGFFKLWEDATNFYVTPAYIDDINVETDIEGGEIVNGAISASSNGNITYP